MGRVEKNVLGVQFSPSLFISPGQATRDIVYVLIPKAHDHPRRRHMSVSVGVVSGKARHEFDLSTP